MFLLFLVTNDNEDTHHQHLTQQMLYRNIRVVFTLTYPWVWPFRKIPAELSETEPNPSNSIATKTDL